MKSKARFSVYSFIHNPLYRVCIMLIGALTPSAALAARMPMLPIRQISKLAMKFARKASPKLSALVNQRYADLQASSLGIKTPAMQKFDNFFDSSMSSFYHFNGKAQPVRVSGVGSQIKLLLLGDIAITKSGGTQGKLVLVNLLLQNTPPVGVP